MEREEEREEEREKERREGERELEGRREKQREASEERFEETFVSASRAGEVRETRAMRLLKIAKAQGSRHIKVRATMITAGAKKTQRTCCALAGST